MPGSRNSNGPFALFHDAGRQITFTPGPKKLDWTRIKGGKLVFLEESTSSYHTLLFFKKKKYRFSPGSRFFLGLMPASHPSTQQPSSTQSKKTLTLDYKSPPVVRQQICPWKRENNRCGCTSQCCSVMKGAAGFELRRKEDDKRRGVVEFGNNVWQDSVSN